MTVAASKPSGRESALTLAAADASGAAALAGTPLLALTRDEELLQTLVRVSPPGHEVRPADSEIEFSAELLKHHAGVAVIDCAAIASPIAELTERLATQFPELVLIVTGGIEEQTVLASRIADGSVHRFLHKPLSDQRVRLFVEAAWRRCAEVRAFPVLRQRSWPGRRGGYRWIPLLLLAALAAVALPFAWIGLYSPGHAPGNPPGGSRTPPGMVREDPELEGLLHRADEALNAGNLTSPPGSSAADLYREALRRNARDPRALNGLEQVIARLLGASEAQLQHGEIDAAQALAEQARALAPKHPRVAFLLGEIGAAREHAVLQKAQRAAAHGNVAGALAVLDDASHAARRPPLVEEARQALAQQQLDVRIADYLGHARDAMSHAQLIEPVEDNARSYIAAARRLAPQDARVAAATRDLIARLESEARQSLAARNPDAAERWTAAAADLGADAARVKELRTQVRELRAASSAEARAGSARHALEETRSALTRNDVDAAGHWLAEARSAGADAAALAELDTALHAAGQRTPPAETYVNENTLTRTHYVAPNFPEEARRRGVDGWVELHFVVGSDGAVSALTVVGAHPAGMFEKAALDAVAQWRYRPPQHNGQAVSQRAQVRLRFQLQ